MQVAPLLAILSFFPVAWSEEKSGIRCYVCNSARDPKCGDPFNPATIELVNCDQFMPEVNSTVCRKNVQRVSLGDRVDLRVVRTCGQENVVTKKSASDTKLNEDKNAVETSSGRCYTRAGTFEVMVTYCTCNESGCNMGSANLPTLLSSLALFTLAFL